ncbi:MAG: sugar/nucleoside kinase (ribokinase family) [Planctomycetota bacterium]|jgi:sugar/nucleoside kinase (ribokinase family)
MRREQIPKIPSYSTMSLLVIGTLAYDDIETAHDSRKGVLGGSATYFAVASSHFIHSHLVGVVGEDFAEKDLQALRDKGIDTAGVEIAPGKTFRWGGRYEADWNTRHTTFTDLNVLEHFDPKVPEAACNSKFVFLANAAPAVQLKGLEQVESPEFVMADTMNLWIDIARPALEALLKRIDAIVLNDEEARMLTGEDNLIRAAGKVLSMGPKLVLLKKGEHGAFIMGADTHFSLPAYPVKNVVDPTGAGDSFAGGFMGYVAAEGSVDPAVMRKAMLHGTVTASFCVEDFGIEPLAMRSKDELAGRYEELLSIVTV